MLVSYIDDARSGSRTSLNLCFSGLTGASISAPAAASPISWSPFADMFLICVVDQIVDIDRALLLLKTDLEVLIWQSPRQRFRV